jgi:hypothetical protein
VYSERSSTPTSTHAELLQADCQQFARLKLAPDPSIRRLQVAPTRAAKIQHTLLGNSLGDVHLSAAEVCVSPWPPPLPHTLPTSLRMQFRHMLAGFGGMDTPHLQHSLSASARAVSMLARARARRNATHMLCNVCDPAIYSIATRWMLHNRHSGQCSHTVALAAAETVREREREQEGRVRSATWSGSTTGKQFAKGRLFPNSVLHARQSSPHAHHFPSPCRIPVRVGRCTEAMSIRADDVINDVINFSRHRRR